MSGVGLNGINLLTMGLYFIIRRPCVFLNLGGIYCPGPVGDYRFPFCHAFVLNLDGGAVFAAAG
ncbi:hypothetical protein ACQWKR_24575, partial [Salmonella enterica subsp. enterica serovar Infantis]